MKFSSLSLRIVCAALFGLASGMLTEALLPFEQYPKSFIFTVVVMSIIYMAIVDYFRRR